MNASLRWKLGLPAPPLLRFREARRQLADQVLEVRDVGVVPALVPTWGPEDLFGTMSPGGCLTTLSDREPGVTVALVHPGVARPPSMSLTHSMRLAEELSLQPVADVVVDMMARMMTIAKVLTAFS